MNRYHPLGKRLGAEQLVQRYDMSDRWGDLFNARQQLALVTFADLVRRAHAEMLAHGADPRIRQSGGDLS
jgi:putative DNA methylase